jgi:hypothetical protein
MSQGVLGILPPTAASQKCYYSYMFRHHGNTFRYVVALLFFLVGETEVRRYAFFDPADRISTLMLDITLCIRAWRNRPQSKFYRTTFLPSWFRRGNRGCIVFMVLLPELPRDQYVKYGATISTAIFKYGGPAHWLFAQYCSPFSEV